MTHRRLLTGFTAMLFVVFLFACGPRAQITCDLDYTHEVREDVDYNRVCEATDANGDAVNLTDVHVTWSDDEFDQDTIGTYPVEWTITVGERSKRFDLVIDVVDSIPPVITLHGEDSIKVDQGANYIDPGASAVDNHDGVVTVYTDVSDVDITTFGIYTVTYRATDDAGNEATLIRTVEVGDVEAPFVSVPASYLYYGGDAIDYMDQIAYITDNFSEEFLIDIDDSAVDLFEEGEYPVIYTVTDMAGNVTVKTMTVKVLVAARAQFDVDIIELLIGGFVLDIKYDDTKAENVFMTLTVDEEPIPEYSDIPVTSDPIEITDLAPDRTYGVLIEYEIIGDAFDRTLTEHLPYLRYIPERYSEEFYDIIPMATYIIVDMPVPSFVREAFDHYEVYDVANDVMVRTSELFPGESYIVADLTPETTYQIRYIYENGWVDTYETTTRPQVSGEVATIRIHYVDLDGDYTNSGIILYTYDEFGQNMTPLELTGVDEFGGYVELSLDLITGYGWTLGMRLDAGTDVELLEGAIKRIDLILNPFLVVLLLFQWTRQK